MATPVLLVMVTTLAGGPLDPRHHVLGGPFDLRGHGGILLAANQVDLDTLTGEVLAVVEQTMQPTRASLWLRPPPGPGVR